MEMQAKVRMAPHLVRDSDGRPRIRAVMEVESDTSCALIVLLDLHDSDSPHLPPGLPSDVVAATTLGWNFFLGLGGREQLAALRSEMRRAG